MANFPAGRKFFLQSGQASQIWPKKPFWPDFWPIWQHSEEVAAPPVGMCIVQKAGLSRKWLEPARAKPWLGSTRLENLRFYVARFGSTRKTDFFKNSSQLEPKYWKLDLARFQNLAARHDSILKNSSTFKSNLVQLKKIGSILARLFKNLHKYIFYS